LCEENSLLRYILDWSNSKGNVTYFERMQKKRFSLSIHLIHMKRKLISGFSKITTARNQLHLLRERYDVRSFQHDFGLLTLYQTKKEVTAIVNTSGLEHRWRKIICSSKLTCQTLRFSEVLFKDVRAQKFPRTDFF